MARCDAGNWCQGQTGAVVVEVASGDATYWASVWAYFVRGTDWDRSSTVGLLREDRERSVGRPKV